MSRAAATTAQALPVDRATREEARLELALAAARAERRNRPTHLLAAALVLLAASLVGLLWAAGKRAAAEIALNNERSAARDYAETASRLERIRSAGGDKPNLIIDSNDRIRSRIIAAAERAGMAADHPGMTSAAALVPTVSQDGKTAASADGKNPAIQRSKFTYQNVKQSSLETMIQWLNYAIEDIPGLEVYMIGIKPEANGWSMTVAFTRWERVGP